MKATIHASTSIPWQPKRAAYFAEGLRRVGVEVRFSSNRFRDSDGIPILLGTTLWREMERDGGEFLLVDRCSYGETDTFVSLVWNGHGRRGDHRVPEYFSAERFESHGIELKPWKTGSKRVVCGQVESYCARDLVQWYGTTGATHFRRHPSGENPTGLPEWRSFDDCELVTLNSSVAVQGIIEGVRTEVHDEGGMAYGCEMNDESRLALMHWLAWTQWTDQEIREGAPWAYHLL